MKKLGFGMMRLPLLDKDNWESVDLEQTARMVDHFLAQGFTYFDTAYPYHNGKSEEAARKALVERHPRDAFTLADKMPVWLIGETAGHADYQKIFDEQLARCGVDHFDYYMLHNLGDKDYPRTRDTGGFDFLKKLKAAGLAQQIGISFHDKADVLDRILVEQPAVEFVQLQINYMDWENDSIESRKCYETARRHGRHIVVMEPVKGGSLADVPDEARQLFENHSPGKSAASWAVRYAASLEGVLTVLSGMSDMEQMLDNTGYMREFRPLDDGERAVLETAREIIRQSIAIPCTACQYCVEECPQNIPIPRYFSLFNDQKQFGMRPLHSAYYNNLSQSHGRAADCIACGQCESHCPQHIGIIAGLEEVSGVFDTGD